MSSYNYLNKVVTIDGKDYLLLSHESDGTKRVNAQGGISIPEVGPDGRTLPSTVTGVYVAKVANSSYTGYDPEDGQLETLVTKSSSIIMYDPQENEFVEISAEKLNLLNKLDVFSPTVFTLVIPGEPISASYSFDEGATWKLWLEQNSTTGLKIYDGSDSDSGLSSGVHIVLAAGSENQAYTSYYVLAHATSSGVSYVQATEEIIKNGKYFLVAPGVPADVTKINVSTGPDYSQTDPTSKSKLDLSVNITQGDIKTTHIVLAVAAQASEADDDDFVYIPWGSEADTDTPASIWSSYIAATNYEANSSDRIRVVALNDTESVKTAVETTITALDADVTYTITVFPVSYVNTIMKVNRSADTGPADRSYIQAKSARFLQRPTARKLTYNGNARSLINNLSSIEADGYAFEYIANESNWDGSSNAISVSNQRQTNAGEYTSELKILTPGYYWLNADGTTPTNLTNKNKFNLTWSIDRNEASPFTVQIPNLGDEYITNFTITVNKASGIVNEPKVTVSKLDSNVGSIEITSRVATSTGWKYKITFSAVTADAKVRITVKPDGVDITNFQPFDGKFDVTIPGLDRTTFGNNSWTAIQHAALCSAIPDSWKVGNTKTITLSAGQIGELTIPKTTVEVMIVNKTSNCLTFCFVKDGKFVAFIDGSFGSNMYGGVLSNTNAVLCMEKEANGRRVNGLKNSMSWGNCFMRKQILGSKIDVADRKKTLYGRLPGDLTSVMGVIEVHSVAANSGTRNASYVAGNYDVLPLMSLSDLGLSLTANDINRDSIPTDDAWKKVTQAKAFQRFTDLRNAGHNIHFCGILDNEVKSKCQIHVRDFWPVVGDFAYTGCSHTKASEHCAFFVYEQGNSFMKPYQDRSRGVAPFFCIGAGSKTVEGSKVIVNYK